MKKLLFVVVIIVLWITWITVAKSEPIEHYPPNPNMVIRVVTPNVTRVIDGTFTNVYIKGDKVSIVNEESNSIVPLENVIITFDNSEDMKP